MRSRKNAGEANGGRGTPESSPVESAADFEVASLKEHDRAKLSFIEAKANLLTVLNNRLQEAGCGPLYSLHYQHLLRYVADVEAYQQNPHQSSPMLHLECDRTEYYKTLYDFRVYGLGMGLIHSELAPAVLQSRKTLVEVFERLSEEDRKSLLPQTSIKISDRHFASSKRVKSNIEVNLWQLKQASLESDYLKSLPAEIERHHPEVYNARIQDALATEEAYLKEPWGDIHRLVLAYAQHASTEEAVAFFMAQIFKPFFAVCMAARDNGDLCLLRAVGHKLNPQEFITWGLVGNCFNDARGRELMEMDLGGWYAKNYPEDAEYLFYEAEKIETVAADSSLEMA